MNDAILIDDVSIIILFNSSLLLQAALPKEFAGTINNDSCAKRVLLFILWPLDVNIELLEVILFCVLFFSFAVWSIYIFLN